jgi:hypothetical protein
MDSRLANEFTATILVLSRGVSWQQWLDPGALNRIEKVRSENRSRFSLHSSATDFREERSIHLQSQINLTE